MYDNQSRLLSTTSDGRTIHSAMDLLGSTGKKNRQARLIPFPGPAFIASVAYVDPGNFATSLQGGAQFGCILVWVIVDSNLMAMLI